jgi:hypothetical protein
MLGVLASITGRADASVLQRFDGSYTVSGGGLGTLLVDTASDAGDWIDAFKDGDDSGTLFYSFDLVVDNAGATGNGMNMFGGLQLYQGASERLAVGSAYSKTDLSVFGYGEAVLNPATPITHGASVRVAVRVDFAANASDTATIWLNPLEGDIDDQPASLITQRTGGTVQFDTVRLRAGNGAAQMTMSDIVFGTRFNDVIDNPAHLPGTVFADNFSEADGTALAGKLPDIGGAWSVSGAAATVSGGIVDTAGAARQAYGSFDRALSAGHTLQLDFETADSAGNFSSVNWAGISLYIGSSERIFIGDPGDSTAAEWGLRGGNGTSLSGNSGVIDESVVGKFLYDFDTGAYELWLNDVLELSGTTQAGLALDRIRLANGGPSALAVDSLSVSLLIPTPAALPAGAALLVVMATRFRRRTRG